MSSRFVMIMLFLHLCNASSQLFEGHEPEEILRMPFQMAGKWRNIGSTKQKRDSGALELTKDELMYDHNIFSFTVSVYDESVPEFEARQNNVCQFWFSFLGYSTCSPNIVSFQGIGYVDNQDKRVSVIDKDAQLMDTFKLLKPRNMQFDEFVNKSELYRSNGNTSWSLYSYKRDGERFSNCSFVMHLDLKELPRRNNYESQLEGSGKLISRKCNIELSVTLHNEQYNLGNSTNTFGIVVALLYMVQLTALALQFMYGWRSHKTFAVSMPSVTLLLFLTMHFVSAISTVTRTTNLRKLPLIVAVISMGLCCAGYTVWLVMIWMERRQTNTKEWMAESVVMLAVATVTYFISYLIMRFIPGGLYLVVFTLYGFFVPQIMSSRKSVHGAIAIHPMFVITTICINAAIPMYLWLKSPNFLNVRYNPILAVALASFLATQAIFLVSQFEQRREQALGEYSSITD